MTPPAAPPRPVRAVDPTPPAAVAAAVSAFLGALVLLWLGVVLWALGTPDAGGIGRAWALVPLAAAAAGVVGGVRLLRRRGRRALAAAGLLAATFVARLFVESAQLDESAPWALALVVLTGPALAVLLAWTPRVRHWLAG